MTDYPYILFNQTPQQLRRVGARGGRASARNRRERLAKADGSSRENVETAPVHLETAAEAIATLDAQFPSLRGAEKSTRATRTSGLNRR